MDTLDLALTVLDRQLVDSQGQRCGRVDDVELSGTLGGASEVTSLLVGQAAAVERLPRWLTRMLRPLTPQHVVAIAWDDVAEVSHVVKLHQTADQLGLNDAERRAARWLARVPGAR